MMRAPPILQLEGITKHFGGLSVLDDLSFAVPPGSRTALIGPNGCGKTTVFNLITGVHPLDAGRIHVDGVDISDLPSRLRIRHGVARNFQNVRLMPHLSALENVMVGQHTRCPGWRGVLQPVNLSSRNVWRVEARAALADAGLGDYERSTAGSLPYGVQKRIEVVRALVAQPRVLLLDEPAAGLNAGETEALQVQLQASCRQRSVALLVVEHDMQFVGALCEHVVVINSGRKIAEGTPEEIREDPRVQEVYLGVPMPESRSIRSRRLQED